MVSSRKMFSSKSTSISEARFVQYTLPLEQHTRKLTPLSPIREMTALRQSVLVLMISRVPTGRSLSGIRAGTVSINYL
jgi:hypothetical protein